MSTRSTRGLATRPVHGSGDGHGSMIVPVFGNAAAETWVLFLATVNQVNHSALGVTRFGQSEVSEDIYRLHGIDADSITAASLDLVDQT